MVHGVTKNQSDWACLPAHALGWSLHSGWSGGQLMSDGWGSFVPPMATWNMVAVGSIQPNPQGSQQTTPDSLWVWPSLGSGQVLPGIPEPWDVSEDSQGQPGQPHQRQVEAMPSYPGSCVGGPDSFLITLCFRQDKIVSLKKHVCGVGVHPEKVRPPGNREQPVRLQNSFASWGLHVQPRGLPGTHSGGANAFKWSGWFWKKMCRFTANISSFLPGT